MRTAAQVVSAPEEWRRRLDDERIGGRIVGVVPTMGSLHAGHLSLIRRAAADCDVVAVTDYVNPLQFTSPADLSAYPRDLEGDRLSASAAGAALLFAPSPAQMWPAEPATQVLVAGPSKGWEGEARPGHFTGVATIVTKLLSLSGPCAAYFGEKDWQQLAVVRRLVADLSLPVQVVACPTVRDPDGLALSSRNAHLSSEERRVAATLYWALLAGKRMIEEGESDDPADVAARVRNVIEAQALMTLDYSAAVDPELLSVPMRLEGTVRLLGAAHLGAIRLIDNLAATAPGGL